MTSRREHEGAGKRPARSGWLAALIALPVLCCAGPAVLAAVGVGSIGALLAAGRGQILLGAILAVLACGLAGLLYRRGRTPPNPGAGPD